MLEIVERVVRLPQLARRKPKTSAVACETDEVLLRILGSELVVTKLLGAGGEVSREDGVVLVTGRGYATGECLVPAEEIYYGGASRPLGEGPWPGEAGKLSWRDEASGYDCIMLRDTHRSFLSGYVGIPREHPLWGWECGAVSLDVGIEVHGGLAYSRVCEHGPSPARRLAVEARRICHVPLTPARYHTAVHANDYRVEDRMLGGSASAATTPTTSSPATFVARLPPCRRRLGRRIAMTPMSDSIPAAEAAVVEFGRHVGELPWGWWLRAGAGGLRDDAGRIWRAV